MEFKRKKKRGINKKVCRHWYTEEGYRLVWRKEVFGIQVPPRFQACVRTIVPGSNFEGGSTVVWDFVNHKRPLFKTMKAAVDECERHKRLWSKATQCTGIRALRELFGRQPHVIPKWVYSKLDRRIVAILMDTTPRGKVDDEEEIGFVPEPEPELPDEKKRKRRSDKGVKRGPRKPKSEESESVAPSEPSEPGEKRKRKQRSDKGKKRGPRKPNPEGIESATPIEPGEKRKRKQRSDKGKKRGPRKPKPEATNGTN